MAPSDNKQLAAEAMFVNDFDVSRLGVIVNSVIERHRAGLSFPDRTTNLPGRVGTVALAREFESNPRRIVVNATQQASSRGQLVEDANELKSRLYDGTIEVRFADDADKVYYCRTEEVDATLDAPAFRKGRAGNTRKTTHRVRITLLAQDPLVYDRNGTVVGFSTAKAEVPTGTAPSLPLIRVFGATSTSTDTTISYKDFRGDEQHVFTLSSTMSVSSTESVSIDMELGKVTHSDGSNLISAMSTDSDFFAFDAQDAAGSTGPYPSVDINTTGVTGDVTYRKAYL